MQVWEQFYTALILHAFGFSALWEVSAFLHSWLFISLVMKEEVDQIRSNQAQVCSVLAVASGGFVCCILNCMGVRLFWSVSANRGSFGRGAPELSQVNGGKMFCAALQGMKLLISTPPLPVPLHLSNMLICSNKSSLCYLTWLTSQCKYERCLPRQLSAFQKWVGSACEIPCSFLDAGCQGLSWHPGSKNQFL